jgi:small subunit ribosomal protein S18
MPIGGSMADNTDNMIDNELGIELGDDQLSEKMPRRYQRRRPRQIVPDYVDWKDVDFLRQFIPERGKIMPRRLSGVSAKDQRRIAAAIKRARIMALLPFVQD